ncbi:MAG: response regulator [Kiloniellales bacterium]
MTETSTGKPAHIVVVDDEESLRDSLEALLESWGYRASLYPDAEALLAAELDGDVSCLLIDLCLPGIDGVSLVETLRQRGLTLPILMMSAKADVPSAVQALQKGAQDFIEKPFDDAPLIERIKTITSQQAGQDESGESRDLFASLTPRESQVLREVVAGQANKMIAHRLGISVKTVEMHRARVMAKSGAKSLAELVRLALAAGVDPAQ